MIRGFIDLTFQEECLNRTCLTEQHEETHRHLRVAWGAWGFPQPDPVPDATESMPKCARPTWKRARAIVRAQARNTSTHLAFLTARSMAALQTMATVMEVPFEWDPNPNLDPTLDQLQDESSDEAEIEGDDEEGHADDNRSSEEVDEDADSDMGSGEVDEDADSNMGSEEFDEDADSDMDSAETLTLSEVRIRGALTRALIAFQSQKVRNAMARIKRAGQTNCIVALSGFSRLRSKLSDETVRNIARFAI